MNGISERELEDYICQHPEAQTQLGDIEILGRQVRVGHGIVDLLAYSEPYCGLDTNDLSYVPLQRLNVIELKVAPLREKDIGQLLRYIYDVRTLLWQDAHENRLLLDYCLKHQTSIGSLQMEYFQESTDVLDEQDYMFQKVSGILIGSDVSSRILAACNAAEIEVFVYDLHDSQFPQFRSKRTFALGDTPVPGAIKEFNRRRAKNGLMSSQLQVDQGLDVLFHGEG